MDQTTRFLKELTEAHGIPGYESPVRQVVRKYMEPLGEVSQDKIGSVICKKAGKAENPRVMIAGHMDEIGFMVKHITDEGFIKFLNLGGWFDQVLLGQRVIVKTQKGDVVGVIGVKPPHLLSAEERAKVIIRKEMYIDIGATSKEEVENDRAYVQVILSYLERILSNWQTEKACCRKPGTTGLVWHL